MDGQIQGVQFLEEAIRNWSEQLGHTAAPEVMSVTLKPWKEQLTFTEGLDYAEDKK